MATVKDVKEKAKKDQENFIDTETLPKMDAGIPLTESELSMIKKLDESRLRVKEEFYVLAISEVNLEERRKKNKQAHLENVEFEKQLGEMLSNKYGDGIVDPTNGVFIPK